jgi:hypothetical protein
MKYLSHYTEEGQTKLFNECGSFFAFSNKQFDDKKKEGVKYVAMGAGLICPKEHTKKLSDGLEEVTKNAIAKDIKENGKKGIISRELSNHECFYVGSIDDALGALSGYGFTTEEVQKVYSDNYAQMAEEW